MDASGIKPKKIDFLNECIAFVFGFSNNKGEVLKHWITFVDGFAYPPEEFYTAIEKELTARKVPSMEISRVQFAQGGWLSGKRTYLRLMRERLALDKQKQREAMRVRLVAEEMNPKHPKNK